jgi:hypothetical protein
MFFYFALVLEMGHNQHDTLETYWSRDTMHKAPSIPVMQYARIPHSENEKLLMGTENVLTDL